MHDYNHRRQDGMVYAMTNAAGNNEVIAFRRGQAGKLDRMNSYDTGGSGTGELIVDPLASQNSLIISRYGHYLFAVNAGSNTISSFHIADSGALSLADVQPSGGIRPNSLSIFKELLYVTNVGDPGSNIASNITGFFVDRYGRLIQIMNSTRPLSTPDAQPSCIVFSPNGRQLVVSELNTNNLSVFQVNRDGTTTGPTANPSSGNGPFGSTFLRSGLLLVTEAGPNALSSYTVEQNGTLDVISSSVLNGQVATCWVAATPCENFAYVANAGSNTISTYHINDDGTLELTRVQYSTLKTLAAPIDIGVSRDGENFYVLNGNQGSITVFAIERCGLLNRLQVFRDTGLPTLGSQGLAVL